MQVSFTDLLLARIPCSSSSFPSTSSRADLNQEFSRPHNAAIDSSTVHHQVSYPDVAEQREFMLGSSQKRKGEASGVSTQLKKPKVGSELLKVSTDSWLLVGRLQLWNKTTSSHLQTCSNTLDCLAFTDGATTICCTAPSLNPQLLGQLVQVTAWTFIPTCHPLDVTSVAPESSRNSEPVPEHAHPPIAVVAVSHGNGRRQGKDLPAYSNSAGGCLEIHSLKLLVESSASTPQVSTFPSLCLNPAAADIRNQVLESPLVKNGKSKPRLRLWGTLHCISPPFVIPSKSCSKNAPSNKDGRPLPKSLFRDESGSRELSESQSMLGFLVELHTCSHNPGCQLHVKPFIPSLDQEVVGASREGVISIYFSGAVAAWRPMLGGMLGDCVSINGLRRKMILLGPERKEFCLFVATRTSLVSHLGPPQLDAKGGKERELQLCKHMFSNQSIQGSRRQEGIAGEARLRGFRCQAAAGVAPCNEVAEGSPQGAGVGSYVGIVTDILMQGQLLELDDQVWLLLTHHNLSQVHGLRVGAMVAVRHAHIITLKSVSEKGLLLGACLRSHVWVVLHSVLNTVWSTNLDYVGAEGKMYLQTRPLVSQPPQSRLNKFIESLPFTLAFWLLQVITSLRCKLQGIYSDKELLGSKKHAGIIRKNVQIILAKPVTIHRDAFKEFLLHERFCPLGDTFAATSLSKVPPLSNFREHVESLWLDPNSLVWQGAHTTNGGGDSRTRMASSGVPRSELGTHYVRHIISSAELGVVLIGSLKVCQSSGKLQLVDAMGALDAVVPDLQSLSTLHCVYQIAQFKLVLEGQYVSPAQSAMGKRDRPADSPLSWSNLLKGVVLEKKPSCLVSCYVHFHLEHARCLEGLTWPSKSQGLQGNTNVLSNCDAKQGPEEFWKGKEFHIVMITHKYPTRLKYSTDQREGNQWTSDAEAILFPYRLLFHRDRDDSLNLPLQSLDLDPRKVRKEVPIADDISDINRQMQHCKKKLEDSGTSANCGDMKYTRCIIECCVCCLVQQCSEDKKIAGQLSSAFTASLVMRGCTARPSTSDSKNTCCSTVEEHRRRQAEGGPEKLLLAFNWRSTEYNQVLRIGGWYLLPILQSDKSVKLSSSLKRVIVDAKHPLLSVHWKILQDCKPSQSNASVHTESSSPAISQSLLFDLPMSATMGCVYKVQEGASLEVQTKARSCDRSSKNLEWELMDPQQPQLVDAVITVSNAMEEDFRNWLADLRGQLVSHLLDVGPTLEHASHPARFVSKKTSKLGEMLHTLSNAVKMESASGIFSLQGEVVSVQGKIETIKYIDPSLSFGEGQLKQPFSSSSSKSCMEQQTMLLELRDLNTDQLIKAQVNFDQYVCPVGLGPGAVTCFHRILLQRGTDLQLRSLPTTLVIVQSVEERFPHLSQGSQQPCMDIPPDNIAQEQDCLLEEDTSRMDLLSNFICQSEPAKDYLRVHCRVVSLQALELQWQGRQSLQSKSRKSVPHHPLPQNDLVESVAVKLACFKIDDGSAVAECCASGKEAAALLGFPGSAGQVLTQCPSFMTLLKHLPPSERQFAQGASLNQVVSLLVQRHKQISVLGEPPQGDAGSTSWLIKGAKGDLGEHEAIVFRVFLQQACQLGPKVVYCSVMSDKQPIANSVREYHQKQASLAASTASHGRPWQTVTWSRTLLVARKVERTDTWKELERLASSL